MSDILPRGVVIDFEEKRREYIIKKVVKSQTLAPEDIAHLLQMHEFLLYISDMESLEDGVDKKTLMDLQGDIQVIREKFDELFEMIK